MYFFVQAEEPEESKVTIKIAFNIITRQEDRNTGATQLTFDYDRQRQNETEGTKYTDESNIMEWKQVKQMIKTRNRWLMRE